MITIRIEKVGGIFYINGKRLGFDQLSEFETSVLNDFIKELKSMTETEQEKFVKEI